MCLPVKPYKVEREWEHAGLKCAVTQGREHQNRCGYVRVPPGHPAHGMDYGEVDVEVHGGLTFSAIEPCAHEDGTGYWFGFDCAHCYDASYEPGFEPDFYKNIGLHDFREHFWSEDEVVAETERLAEQLATGNRGSKTREAAKPALKYHFPRGKGHT